MAEHDSNRRSDPPPPVRRGPAQPVLLVVGALVLFSILVLVVMNIDTGANKRQPPPMPNDVIELVTPRGLNQDDLRPGGDGRADLQPELSRGGVVEIADPDTQALVQRYRFERLDPNPQGEAPGWLRMVQPRMEIFLDDNRVVTLASDSALAYRPHRAIESGTMTGNVIVRLYEGRDGQDVDLNHDEPDWTVTTDEASLDNFLGEIRCDGDVLIESDIMTLPGRSLRLLVDDQANRIELRIAEPEYIRLVSRHHTRHALHRPTQPHRSRAVHRPNKPVAITRASHTPQKSAQFYLLTLTDDIVIKQNDLLNRRTATGDRLQVVFSTQTSGLESTLARQHPATASALHRADDYAPYAMPLTLSSWLALQAMAMVDDQLTDDDEHLLGPDITLIRSSGPLTIVPLDDSTRHLASVEDARLELAGSPVHLTDASNNSFATGTVLTYHTGLERLELVGNVQHPMQLSSPELMAGGEKLVHSQLERVASIEGAGWMNHRDDQQPADQPAQQPRTELQITWRNGMDLYFDDSASDASGKLQRARFDGDVKVITDDFTMDAQEMSVFFAEGVDREAGIDANSIQAIHARGSVRVLGLADAGSIQCQDLTLELMQSAAGETVPRLMIATGSVEAIDEDQIIWCESLRVQFIENHDARAQVEELIAEDDVQVLLADGTRAFSDRLVGDGLRETIELTGEDVTIISDTMVMDRGKRLILDRGAGTARSPGPGTLRIFDQPVLDDGRSRIRRPSIAPDRPSNLSARWGESMLYDSTFNDGAGSVDFRGDVDVLSNPTPLEKNTMTGQSLTIEFVQMQQPSTAVPSEQSSDSRIDTQRGKRDVSKLIARQDARIESQTFVSPDRDDEPSIFHIAGDYVEYDTRTTAAFVAGSGTLLIHDRTPDDNASDATPFGAKGTTLMRWTRELRLTPDVDNVYNMVARGEVELRHQDLSNAVSWLTCEQLDAVVKRQDTANGQPRQSQGLDVGGSAELERVQGTGGVIIRTDQRTVDCDAFDYNVASGFARLMAYGNGIISIQTQGSPNVVTASEAIWNMQRDSIQIIRGAGASRD